MKHNKVKQIIKHILNEDVVSFKNTTSNTLYSKLGNKLQNNYKTMSKNIFEASGGDNMTAYWGAGLGGALGQGSPANQFMDYLENSGIYVNLQAVSTYNTNAQWASNLQNFPPQGSTSANIMNNKGWTRKDNGLGGYTYFSPGGWEWSYANGKWYLRPNEHGGGGGGFGGGGGTGGFGG